MEGKQALRGKRRTAREARMASALAALDGPPASFYLSPALSELRFTAREARIVSAPAALLCPNNKRGKDPWSFSPLGSPFSFKTRQKTRNTKRRKNARSAITQRQKTQKYIRKV